MPFHRNQHPKTWYKLQTAIQSPGQRPRESDCWLVNMPRHLRPIPLLRSAVLMLAVAWLAACNRTAIVEGQVQDFKGEALPGVIVTVRGQGVQALTDARGDYRLRAAPGWQELELAKTGYTPGRVATGELRHGWNEVPDATLWPLPVDRGIFILSDYRYIPLDRGEPKPFATRDFGKVYATTTEIDRTIEGTDPRIICHRMPPYDLRMHQVTEVLGADPEMEPPDYTRPVWAPMRDIPIVIAPIDEPEKLLIVVQPTQPLTPGTYAVHWGALDGYTGTDPRAFLFRIADPDAEPAEEAPDDEVGDEEEASANT